MLISGTLIDEPAKINTFSKCKQVREELELKISENMKDNRNIKMELSLNLQEWVLRKRKIMGRT